MSHYVDKIPSPRYYPSILGNDETRSIIYSFLFGKVLKLICFVLMSWYICMIQIKSKHNTTVTFCAFDHFPLSLACLEPFQVWYRLHTGRQFIDVFHCRWIELAHFVINCVRRIKTIQVSFTRALRCLTGTDHHAIQFQGLETILLWQK